MKSLTPHTVYYVRAYAVNSAGTGYGNEISFNSGFVIGTIHDGGFVFYNDGNGKGLICAHADDVNTAPWGCQYSTIGGTSTAVGTGAANTNAIINACSTVGIAARICNDFVIYTFNDWFLPSKDELNLMYTKLHTQNMGGFTGTTFYWTSSEHSSGSAFAQHFANGYQDSQSKGYNLRIRAVRAF
jgi:hypothetical protein